MERSAVIFAGHGSPMNALEDNIFTKTWKKIGEELPKPAAILAISAHWYTKGTKAAGSEAPKMIYDMYGFPKKLYEIKYNAPGSRKTAERVKEILTDGETACSIDNEMGFDHGIWSILCHMYPDADIPVVEMSVNRQLEPKEHFKIGKMLSAIREEGILILCSGNIVHNFEHIEFDKDDGYAEAERFDNYIKEAVLGKDFNKAVYLKGMEREARFAFATPDHYFPLLYALGAAHDDDKITVFNNKTVMGALSMTGYIFHKEEIKL